MDSKLAKVENNVAELEITVENDKFKDAIQKSYKKNASTFNVPGFRKGKAPLAIIKRYYGEEVLYEDAIEFCCQDTYPMAIEQHSLKPIDYPKIDIIQVGSDKDLIYSAKVVVSPEVELGEYKGLEVKDVKNEVKDEDVDNEIKNIQGKNARIETKDENAVIEKGNIAVVDFKGFIDGVAFEGGEGKDYPLEIGSGTFIDTFEEQLIGLKKDDEKEINVTFPEDYGKEEFNGKPALFKVTIKEIRVKELPELDDDFAKEVSEFDTFEEYKNDVKNKLQESSDNKAKAEYTENAVAAACDNANINIPDILVNKEIDVMLRDFELRLKYQGMDLKQYYEYTGTSEDKIRDQMRENAEKHVKTDLVFGKISEVEEIKATEEELNEKAKNIAAEYGNKDPEEFAKSILANQKQYIEIEVVNEKVVNLIVDNSKRI